MNNYRRLILLFSGVAILAKCTIPSQQNTERDEYVLVHYCPKKMCAKPALDAPAYREDMKALEGISVKERVECIESKQRSSCSSSSASRKSYRNSILDESDSSTQMIYVNPIYEENSPMLHNNHSEDKLYDSEIFQIVSDNSCRMEEPSSKILCSLSDHRDTQQMPTPFIVVNEKRELKPETPLLITTVEREDIDEKNSSSPNNSDLEEMDIPESKKAHAKKYRCVLKEILQGKAEIINIGDKKSANNVRCNDECDNNLSITSSPTSDLIRSWDSEEENPHVSYADDDFLPFFYLPEAMKQYGRDVCEEAVGILKLGTKGEFFLPDDFCNSLLCPAKVLSAEKRTILFFLFLKRFPKFIFTKHLEEIVLSEQISLPALVECLVMPEHKLALQKIFSEDCFVEVLKRIHNSTDNQEKQEKMVQLAEEYYWLFGARLSEGKEDNYFRKMFPTPTEGFGGIHLKILEKMRENLHHIDARLKENRKEHYTAHKKELAEMKVSDPTNFSLNKYLKFEKYVGVTPSFRLKNKRLMKDPSKIANIIRNMHKGNPSLCKRIIAQITNIDTEKIIFTSEDESLHTAAVECGLLERISFDALLSTRYTGENCKHTKANSGNTLYERLANNEFPILSNFIIRSAKEIVPRTYKFAKFFNTSESDRKVFFRLPLDIRKKTYELLNPEDHYDAFSRIETRREKILFLRHIPTVTSLFLSIAKQFEIASDFPAGKTVSGEKNSGDKEDIILSGIFLGRLLCDQWRTLLDKEAELKKEIETLLVINPETKEKWGNEKEYFVCEKMEGIKDAVIRWEEGKTVEDIINLVKLGERPNMKLPADVNFLGIAFCRKDTLKSFQIIGERLALKLYDVYLFGRMDANPDCDFTQKMLLELPEEIVRTFQAKRKNYLPSESIFEDMLLESEDLTPSFRKILWKVTSIELDSYVKEGEENSSHEKNPFKEYRKLKTFLVTTPKSLSGCKTVSAVSYYYAFSSDYTEQTEFPKNAFAMFVNSIKMRKAQKCVECRKMITGEEKLFLSKGCLHSLCKGCIKILRKKPDTGTEECRICPDEKY